MDFHSPIPFDHFDPSRLKTDSSEFASEEYQEYRRRVYEELASEYDKLGGSDKQQQKQYQHYLITDIPGEYHLTDIQDYPASPTSPIPDYSYSSSLHSTNSTVHDNILISVAETPEDLSSQQPTWDDSDLQTEPVALRSPPQSLRTNLLSFSDEDVSNDNGIVDNLYTEDIGDFDGQNNIVHANIPTMHWTELGTQLENMTKYHNEKSNSPKAESSRVQPELSPPTRCRSSRSNLLKQKKDREAIRQKLSMGDTDIESPQHGAEKPWYQPRNNQNLQICYINDSCSSSESEDNGQFVAQESKSSLLTKNSPSGGKTSPASSPVLSSPGFGIRKNFPLYRMPSTSSTVSLSSTSSAGHHTSSSSLPGDGEIINIRSSVHSAAEDIPKVKTRQEQLELQARIAITQAHQEARKQAEEERRRNRKGSKSSTERLLQVPLNDSTRLKVKTRSLEKDDCCKMTLGQLQVILNEMHTEKEALNSELKVILEIRDELRTEQDAKLIDVEDMKAMLSVTGPETTV